MFDHLGLKIKFILHFTITLFGYLEYLDLNLLKKNENYYETYIICYKAFLEKQSWKPTNNV